MAKFFLQCSSTYADDVGPELMKRREAVCRYLKDDTYKVSRTDGDDKVFALVQAELAKEDVPISRSQYNNDKVILRQTYLWLTEGKLPRASSRSSADFAIECLKADGITSWDDVLSLQEQEESESAEPEEEEAFNLSDYKAGEEAIQAWTDLNRAIGKMMRENDALKEEIERQGEELEGSKAALANRDGYIKLLHEEIDLLEARLQETRATIRDIHSAKFEDIAENYPEFAKTLYPIIKQLRSRQNSRTQRIAHYRSLLPDEFSWESGKVPVIYESSFLKKLDRLTDDERQQVIKQLELLATEGEGYNSLDTTKYTWPLTHNEPVPCKVSRGSDDLRFSWWQSNGTVRIYQLYHHGELKY